MPTSPLYTGIYGTGSVVPVLHTHVCGGRVKTPKHVLLPLTVQHLMNTKNTEIFTLISNCSAACSCNNCSNSTEEGSVVGNDDIPIDDDIDEQEDYN